MMKDQQMNYPVMRVGWGGRDLPQQQACPPGDDTAAAPPARVSPPAPVAPAQSSFSGLQGATQMCSAVSEGGLVTAALHTVYLSDTHSTNAAEANPPKFLSYFFLHTLINMHIVNHTTPDITMGSKMECYSKFICIYTYADTFDKQKSETFALLLSFFPFERSVFIPPLSLV